jgi:hypothetical protein
VKETEVLGVWRDHVEFCAAHRAEWTLHRAAFETRMWERGRPFGLEYNQVREKLEFLIEMNRVEPFISTLGANLFLRPPRTVIRLPGVQPRREGRPPNTRDQADRARAVADDWLWRANVQECAIDAYRMALMYGAAGFRLGTEERPEAMDRIWIEACPRWECLWDRFATPRQERYRGHTRLRLIEEVREITGATLDDIPESALVPLQDAVNDGLTDRTFPGGSSRGQPYRGYVRLIEFYDLHERTQTFYLVTGGGESTAIRQIGDIEDVPWEYPDGTPAVPLVPAVLLHPPESPLDGIPAVRRVVQIAAEQNLVASIVTNAARRDAARTIAIKPGTFAESELTRFKSGLDLEILETLDADVDLSTAWAALQTPPLPSSIGVAMDVLEKGWRDVQGTSDIQQGRQASYVSAREAGLLAAYGERAISEIQSQMNGCLADVVRLMFAALSAEKETKKGLTVYVNGNMQRVTAEDLSLPWEITIAEGGSTPVTEEARKVDFAGVQPILMTLTNIAAGAPGADGQPPNPRVQRMAQIQLNHLVRLHGLPEEMSWDRMERDVPAAEAGPSAEEMASAMQTVPAGVDVEAPPPSTGEPLLPPRGGPLGGV